MANLYGVANAPGLPSMFSNVADVVCPAGSYTAILSTPALVAPSQGYFYAMVWVGLEISLGATLPTGLQTALAIGAGSYVNPSAYGTTGLVANGFVFLPYYLFTAPSQTAWQGAGSIVNVGFQPGGQAVTIKQFSQATVCLFRAPDQ